MFSCLCYGLFYCNNMKHNATAKFVKVTDGRGKPIEGMWSRNGKFYAQLRLRDPETGITKPTRKRLEAATVTEAKKALRDLLQSRDTGTAPTAKVPVLFDYMRDWLKQYKASNPRSYNARQSQVRYWQKTSIDRQKIDTIQPAQLRNLIAEMQTAGASNNTILARMDVLGMVFKQALIDGLISKNPLQHIRRPERENKKRELFALSDIETFADAHNQVPTFGADGRDLTLFLAFSGLRLGEALKTKWAHIDWSNQQVRVGVDYLTKNGEQREVDFNSRLEAQLEDMKKRRLPDSDWLFPSYHGENQHAVEPPESWNHAKRATKLSIGPHDLRHFFISYCVMSGCDWLSIAHWVGHQDATLIAKVYAHLRPDYRRKQAQQITFEPVIVGKEAA